MGIPNLIATLKCYTIHEPLQGQGAVIDGPAMAYHMLHLCRTNGIAHPSYELLGRVALKWLDELDHQNVHM